MEQRCLARTITIETFVLPRYFISPAFLVCDWMGVPVRVDGCVCVRACVLSVHALGVRVNKHGLGVPAIAKMKWVWRRLGFVRTDYVRYII